MEPRVKIPSAEDLLLAEKQVYTGIYRRLAVRLKTRYNDSFNEKLAKAITSVLFSYEPSDEKEHYFFDENQQQISQEIKKLREDKEIKRIVTDTIVLKIVYQHKKRGCNTDDMNRPLEKLKEFGLFLEGINPPTPQSFVRMARDFYAATPK